MLAVTPYRIAILTERLPHMAMMAFQGERGHLVIVTLNS